jgi:hypothetical protein
MFLSIFTTKSSAGNGTAGVRVLFGSIFGLSAGNVRVSVALAALASGVIRESGILHVEVVATQAGGQTFPESPDDLRVHAPIMEGLRDRERLIDAASHSSEIPQRIQVSSCRSRFMFETARIRPHHATASRSNSFSRSTTHSSAVLKPLSSASVFFIAPTYGSPHWSARVKL